MVFTELTRAETMVNVFMWLFMIGMLLTTIGMSGVVNFRLLQVKNNAPLRYKGKRRAPSDPFAIIRFFVQRYDLPVRANGGRLSNRR